MSHQDSNSQPETNRLNKYLAFHLGLSRRKADDLIASGKITINGEKAVLGARIKPEDKIAVSGHEVAEKKDFTYIAFHKPRGFVCSRKQQGETPTIYSILPRDLSHLKPVGRLDADSSGILLLSDDGDFTQRMTHPKYSKQKEYIVTLDNALAPLHQQMIADFGVNLTDGRSQLGLTRLDDDRKRWNVTMSEGRNRQIRRTFGALGYTVVELHRTHFGPYTLEGLGEGKYQTTKPV